MWNSKQIIADLKDWIEDYEELRETCKRDLVNAYKKTDKQVIEAQIDLFDNFIEGLEWTIEKANGNVPGYEDQWK